MILNKLNFSIIQDTRSNRNQRHSLSDIIMLTICAVLSGCNEWNEIEDYGNQKLEWLKTFIPLKNGVPTHDTINRLFTHLDPKCVQKCFLEWVNQACELSGGIKTMPIPWAEPYVSYTRLFAIFLIQILQSVKEQKTTAQICKTSEIIVRKIMDNVVESALEIRGYETYLTHISLDEKSFGEGHKYASILIDAKQNKVVECVEGRATNNTNLLYYLSTGESVNENITIVSMDMWNGFIKATEESVFMPEYG